MRPIYESDNDRIREQKVKAYLEQRWQCVAKKMKMSYGWDFIFYRSGVARAVVEYKFRKIDSINQYGDIFLSLQKVQVGRLFQREGLATVFVVEINDGSLWQHVLKPGVVYRTGWGGRFDRNDDADMEPVIHINHEDFSKIR